MADRGLKLAFSTLCCMGWTVDRVIAYCQEYGFEGIELRLGENAIMSAGMTEAERIRAAVKLRSAGIDVTDIASSVCIKGISTEELNLAGQELRSAFEVAENFEARGIRIFLGNFMRRYDDPTEGIDSGNLEEFLKKYCVEARNRGLQLWIETHNEYAKGEDLRKLLDQVCQENCKVIWDVLHPLEDGEDPEETWKWLKKDCVHVHIKDGNPFGDAIHHDWKYTFIGEGLVPLSRIVDILRRGGYKGYYSLEWESAWREELNVPEAGAEAVLPAYAEYMRHLIY